MAKSKVDKLIDKFNTKYGAGTIVRASDARGLRVQRFSSGSGVLDAALGGGLAEGRWNELVGAESSFKTTMAQKACARFQQKYKKGKVLYVDCESPSFDAAYAEKCGMDLDRTDLVQTESGEEAGDIIFERMEGLESGVELLVVVDSIAAMLPLKELESDMGDSTPAAHARLVAKFVRRTKSLMKPDFLTNRPVKTLLVLNQRRAKFNSMPWADNEGTTGGHCLEHGVDIRIKFKKGEPIAKEQVVNGVKIKRIYGRKVYFTVQKNKTGMTLFERGVFTFMTREHNGVGKFQVDNAADLLPLAQAYGVAEVHNGTYKFLSNVYKISRLNDEPECVSELVAAIVNGDEETATEQVDLEIG